VVGRPYAILFTGFTFHYALKLYFVSPSTNKLHSLVMSFDPCCVHTMEAVLWLCLKVLDGLYL
jgi:hypothetical protein